MVSRTLRMVRFRGKRVWYLVFAAFVTFLIFQWSHESDPIIEFELPVPAQKDEAVPKDDGKPVGEALPPAAHVEDEVKTTSVPVVEITSSYAPSSTPTGKKEALETSAAVAEQTSTLAPTSIISDIVLPDGQTSPTSTLTDPHARPSDEQGRKEVSSFSATTTIHWKKQTEHFPVPTDSIIPLPTGAAVPIPKIQFQFKDETPDAKIKREKRQSKVKAEFQKAWKGYREKAWLHDELSPKSGGFRDPFCGWAASLVDGLDTLFIMGLENEFEEAVKAVGTLDFTTSQRQDIPMFETTIRYLGGMIAAYDVSGRKHQVLLDKTVELADIMMGAFDTPNRLPILFYYWAPDFASQPHRASATANTAELGSLSLEFTRLAQLTKEPRYYDAVARISNALSEWQDQGTTGLDGVFPESIDTSGCNRTENSTPIAVSAGRGPAGNMGEHALGYQALGNKKDVGKPKPDVTVKSEDPDVVNVDIASSITAKATLVDKTAEPTSEQTSRVEKRDEVNTLNSTTSVMESVMNVESAATNSDMPTGVPTKTPDMPKFITPTRVKEDWDCKPQGLQKSNPYTNKYGMGGGQDSTYEYMPKEYLLLGGREQMYGKMYLKTMETVRKEFIFRAMLPTHRDRDILFSGAIQTYQAFDESAKTNITKNLIPEVEHLTCFIGGMVGMGSKIFDLPDDLELAKMLTDGCVWAYESFAQGIMPESSTVVACEDKADCPWSEAFYRLALDTEGAEVRDARIAKYVADKKKAEADAAKAAKKAANKAAKEAEARENSPGVNATTTVGGNSALGSASLQVTSIAEATSKPADTVVGSDLSDSVKATTAESSLSSAPSGSGEPLASNTANSAETTIATSSNSVETLASITANSVETTIASTITPVDLPASDISNSTETIVASPSNSVETSVSSQTVPSMETPVESDKSTKDKPVAQRKRSLEELQKKDEVEAKLDEPVQKDSDLTPLPEKSKPRPNNHLEPLPTDSSPNDGKRVSPESQEIKDITHTEDNIDPSEKAYIDFVRENEVGSGRDTSLVLNETEAVIAATKVIDPLMPLTHDQFVDARIKEENLPPGFVTIQSRKYILRPEAIESVWYMYRITGDPIWQDKGWRMFEAIINATSTTYGHSAINDVAAKEPILLDEMESFWLAETLKYFYLLFSTPDTISLDDWVLNTEAHPFRRPET